MISDQDIKSYLAGDASTALAAQIEAEAEASADFADRVAGFDPMAETVKAALRRFSAARLMALKCHSGRRRGASGPLRLPWLLWLGLGAKWPQ